MDNHDSKKKFVRARFASISNKYDFVNSILSLQIDRYWRWLTTRELKMFQDGIVLDLCAGTLPLSVELTRQAPGRQVCAIDFCQEMLSAGVNKLADDNRKSLIFPVCGDGEQIPALSDVFCGVTVAFGVRNLARTQQGINEMHRVLKNKGKLLILEFSRPTNRIINPLYSFYLNRILPKIAGFISGDIEAYEYLASSIADFYEPDELLQIMKKAGFTKTYHKPLTFGIVTLYVGVK